MTTANARSAAKYRQTHPERVKAIRARYRARNREKIKLGNKKYRSENPEKARASTVAWCLAHPDQKRAQSQRRRARIRTTTIEQFEDTEIFERDEWMCGICHEPIDPELKWPDPWSVSLDHVIALVNGGTHTRANVQASHLWCNKSKGQRS